MGECPHCKEELAKDTSNTIDAIKKAFQLGKTYWSQADSESYSQNRKSSQTYAAYIELINRFSP